MIRARLLVAAIVACALAACGGGSSSPTPAPAAPTGTTLVPGGGSLPFPAVNGYAATLVYGTNNGGAATVALGTSTTALSGLPVPPVGAQLANFTFVFSSTVTINGAGISPVIIPSSVPTAGQVFGLYVYDVTGGTVLGGGSGGVVSGQTLTFPSGGNATTLTAGRTYAAVLTSTPATATSSTPISPAGGTIALPSVGGYTGTFNYPANNATAGTTVAATASLTPITTLPAPTPKGTQLVNYSLVFSSNTTFVAGAFGFSPIVIPAVISPAGATFTTNSYDLTGNTALGNASTGTLAGQTVTFPIATSGSTPITAGRNYTAVFAGS